MLPVDRKKRHKFCKKTQNFRPFLRQLKQALEHQKLTMDLTILGTVLTTIGAGLTLWSLLYARAQSKKVSDLKRNQNITLWAAISRVGRSISDICEITDDNQFIENGQLTEKQKQILPKIHRGLTDQYIRLAELIIQNDIDITKSDVEKWNEEKRSGLETQWRKSQFINLLQAGSGGNGSNKKIKRTHDS